MNKLLSQVPLQILTGFLGSGKTTLLNKIINTPKMKGTVLIINEVGEIGIDDKLISSESPVVLLDSGCICCSVQDGLVNALQFLADQKQQGELSFNRVIIETTGIADPAPIITLLFDYIEIECNYSFAGTITVIDGVNAKDELAKNYEAVKQIALADKIIISKEDRISKNDLDRAYSTTRKKQTQFFTMQSTAKIPCGTRAIISYDLSVAARSVIHHITYRTSMTYSLCGLMKRIPIFGAKQPEQAERTL